MTGLSKIVYYGKAMYAMKRAHERVPYVPEYVAIEVTNVCNFRCSFCPQSDPEHHTFVPKGYLDLETCELFLKKIRAAGVKTNLMHWTQDGEPFMNKNFDRICSLGVTYGFTKTFFASNGMLCTPERLEKFPVEDCQFVIAVDYCADKEYFEHVRGTPRSWNTIKENILQVLKNGRLRNVNFYITDISSFAFSDPIILKRNFAALQRMFPENGRITFAGRKFHNATGFLAAKESERSGSYHLCPYPWTTLRVTCSGDVVACCRDLRRKTVLGNLKHQDLPDIWNGPAMQELRRNLLNRRPDLSAACDGCDLPYDDSKFSFANLLKAAKGRMQLFG